MASRGRLPRSNAKWVSLGRELVTVPAKGTERIDFEVRVPGGKGQALAGTYWSMIMVEPIAQGSQESANPADKAARVTQLLRYGVQVATSVGRPGPASLAFANPQLLKEADRQLFTIDVANNGQRLLRPTLWLEVYSQKGKPVGKFQGAETRLYPGTSARFKMDLGRTAPGKYLGLVAADGTGNDLFGANVELDIQ
jgi:hypothetical protein